MSYKNYTHYALIREDNRSIYNDQEVIIRNKVKDGEISNLSISEAIYYFTGISISLIEKSISQFGVTELRKHIYSMKITTAKRKKLELLLSLYNEIHSVEAAKRFNVNSPVRIADFLYSKIGSSQIENFYVIYLNTKCDVLGSELLFIGGCSQCIVDIPTLFKKVLINGAINIIIAHNHPSCNPSPSMEDTNITKAIKTAGDLLKINLLDHVIIGSYQKYYSFKENGII